MLICSGKVAKNKIAVKFSSFSSNPGVTSEFKHGEGRDGQFQIR